MGCNSLRCNVLAPHTNSERRKHPASCDQERYGQCPSGRRAQQEAFGLSERKMEDQPECQGRFDRHFRAPPLSTQGCPLGEVPNRRWRPAPTRGSHRPGGGARDRTSASSRSGTASCITDEPSTSSVISSHLRVERVSHAEKTPTRFPVDWTAPIYAPAPLSSSKLLEERK